MKTLTTLVVAAAATLIPQPAAAQSCGSGSTVTHYLSGNGNYAVMFDITPTTDMTIECIDVNMWSSGATVDASFWYSVGTCVGQETNPAAWTQFASVAGVAGQAPNTATNLDISGNGQVFSAGQTYGIYIQCPTAILAYTNGGPTTFNGDHCDLTTYYGSTLNWGGVNIYREFNGELHTEPTVTGPTLSATGCAGAQSVGGSGFAPGSSVAIGYSLTAGSFVLPGGACAGVTIDLVAPTLAGVFTADGSGNFSIPANFGAVVCGNLHLQAGELPSCTLSNLLSL